MPAETSARPAAEAGTWELGRNGIYSTSQGVGPPWTRAVAAGTEISSLDFLVATLVCGLCIFFPPPPKLLSSEARQNNGLLNSFKEVERKPWEALLPPPPPPRLLPVNHSSGLGAGKSQLSIQSQTPRFLNS